MIRIQSLVDGVSMSLWISVMASSMEMNYTALANLSNMLKMSCFIKESINLEDLANKESCMDLQKE